MDAAVWEVLTALVLGEAKGGPSLPHALRDCGRPGVGGVRRRVTHNSFWILKIIYSEDIIKLFGMSTVSLRHPSSLKILAAPSLLFPLHCTCYLMSIERRDECYLLLGIGITKRNTTEIPKFKYYILRI